MPHVVTQSCCVDASCVVACPVNCIHPAPGEPGFGTTEMLFVDPATCVGCGACTTACPVGAIVPATSLSEDQRPFLDLNADYFRHSPHQERRPLAAVPKQRRLRRPGPFSVAIVGAGPAGLYTADELLKHPEITCVDVYDRLATPYGLIRHGVAPDHPATKSAADMFRSIEDEVGFNYVLGMDVGTDVSLADLRSAYHAVVVAVGASTDRRLNVAGENLVGSVAATEMVGWYNGHPSQDSFHPRLDHERAVVIGNGNVALDIARMLTRDPDWLERETDTPPHVLAQLRNSAVREVQVVGRRGPAEAAFTVPELLGLTSMQGVDVVVDAPRHLLAGDDPKSRIIADIAARSTPDDPGVRQRIVLRFALALEEIMGRDGQVDGIRLARTGLSSTPDGGVTATPTTEKVTVSAGLLVRSTGFRGNPVDGVPFDPVTTTVPNDHGDVGDGVFVSGWIKRGARGFIGTNKACAQETVDRILDHLDGADHTLSTTPAALRATLPGFVDRDGWRRRDAREVLLGADEGRVRVKTRTHEDIRAALRRQR